uniref:Alpha glucosidase n=1 Tax=Salmo trutta TaxID=8032 RepID=A0A673W168_SALTR
MLFSGRTGRLVRIEGKMNRISTLRLEILDETEGRLHLTLKDPLSQRYEVPLSTAQSRGNTDTQDHQYVTEFQPDPFGFIVPCHLCPLSVSVNTTVAPLLYADQYLQLFTSLASSLVSGLGEHYTPLSLDVNWTSLTLWNRDIVPHGDANLHGSHPFYMVQEGGGQAHGVFLLNSNAMEVVLQPSPALTWVAVGGILDLYIFLGPDPQSVVRQYLQVIANVYPVLLLGYPMMLPYWSLGFHLCRWGYRSTNATREVVRRMHNANFPLDVQWNDLDYTDKHQVFTFDPQRFVDQPDMLKEFHQKGMKYILILDPGISSTSPPGTYPPFDKGQRRGVFIRNSTGQTLIGKVWPGPTALPDFTNPETQSWWEDFIRYILFLLSLCSQDMNEPDSFVQGCVEGCPDSDLDSPPYVPWVVGGQLNTGTLCMSAQQNQSTHYNLHNLYGLMEASATHSALVKVWGSRPFVLSHSFPGIGRFSGVWTGDVRSDWEQLRYSIPGEGKDIRCCCLACSGCPWWGRMCVGLGGDTTEELCVRWTQLGAFYPFMRNHNDKPNAPQELYVFGLEAQAAMRSAVMLRYSLLPFLYTLFYHTHTSADTVGTPLFLQFPSDPNCQTIDRQFLWGSSLLVRPVLEQGAVELAAYLPPGTWYSLQPFYSKGQYPLLPAPLDTINVHVREGHIIPQQEPGLTTSASRSNPFLLMVALSAGGWAWGDLFWDGGDSLDTFQRGYYSCVIFIAGQVGDVENGALDGLVLGGLRVFGVPSPPRYVWANGKKVWDFSYRTDTKVSGSWLSYLYRV